MKDAVEQLELARGAPQVVGGGGLARGVLLVAVEEEGVVAHLAQLHLDVVEAADADLARVADGREALPLDVAVHELLHRGELALEDVLGGYSGGGCGVCALTPINDCPHDVLASANAAVLGQRRARSIPSSSSHVIDIALKGARRKTSHM